LLKEIGGAKGDFAPLLQLPAADAAIKLMTPSTQHAVGDAVTHLDETMAKIGTQDEHNSTKLLKATYEGASQVVQKCGQDADCYLKQPDQPIPTGPLAANAGAIKACYMTVVYAGPDKDAKRAQLVSRVDKMKNPGARLALVEAIDQLAPKGDAAAAATL